MFDSCKEAVEWVTSRRNQNKGLAHFAAYMKLHGEAMNSLAMIHVAGTNGKGSTCNYLTDCLIAAGYKVGMFTSPHLIAHQDRITVNHRWIGDADFLRLCNQRLALWESWELNMFEIDFDLMCLYFKEQQVDFAVVEVGLGGRLDATNVMPCPLAAVIVSIGLDHTDRLGVTKEEIAFEKAGIIKEGGLVICAENEDGPKEVIRQIAKDRHACFISVPESELLSAVPLRFISQGIEIELNTLAQYQRHNASCALQVLLSLKKAGKIHISSEQIQAGMRKSLWQGRFEVLGRNPLLIVDGAHNEHGVDALIQSLTLLPKPCCLVFAALKDKDYPEMICRLHQAVDQMTITTFDYWRAAPAEYLNTEEGLKLQPDWRLAIKEAQKEAGKAGSVVVTGSLYFISEVVIEWKSAPEANSLAKRSA